MAKLWTAYDAHGEHTMLIHKAHPHLKCIMSLKTLHAKTRFDSIKLKARQTMHHHTTGTLVSQSSHPMSFRLTKYIVVADSFAIHNKLLLCLSFKSMEIRKEHSQIPKRNNRAMNDPLSCSGLWGEVWRRNKQEPKIYSQTLILGQATLFDKIEAYKPKKKRQTTPLSEWNERKETLDFPS